MIGSQRKPFQALPYAWREWGPARNPRTWRVPGHAAILRVTARTANTMITKAICCAKSMNQSIAAALLTAASLMWCGKILKLLAEIGEYGIQEIPEYNNLPLSSELAADLHVDVFAGRPVSVTGINAHARVRAALPLSGDHSVVASRPTARRSGGPSSSPALFSIQPTS